MKNETRLTVCTWASIAAILTGFALIIAGLAPVSMPSWGSVATGFVPQAVLIAGGLLALAVCSHRRGE